MGRVDDGGPGADATPPVADAGPFAVTDADAGDECVGDTFRDDFETDITGYSVGEEGGSTIERSSVRAHGGRRSLRLSLGSADGAQATWRRGFGTAKRVRYCYFLWLDPGVEGRTINIGTMDFRNPADRLFVTFASVQRENMVFAGQEISPKESYKSFASRAAITERWTKVVFDVDLTTPPGTLTPS